MLLYDLNYVMFFRIVFLLFVSLPTDFECECCVVFVFRYDDEALREYNLAFDVLAARSGEFHPITSPVLNGIACIHTDRHEIDEAIRYATNSMRQTTAQFEMYLLEYVLFAVCVTVTSGDSSSTCAFAECT